MKIVFGLWKMGIQASILICIVLAVRFLLKKYPKIYSYCLWALVGIRLLCPIWIESPFSLLPGLPLTGYEATEQKTAEPEQTITSVQNELLSGDIRQEETSGAKAQGKGIQQDGPAPAVVQEKGQSGKVLLKGRGVSVPENIYKLLAAVYIMGVLCLSAFYIVQYLTLKRRLSTAIWEQDNIWLDRESQSPFVMGIVAPKIYLPYNMTDKRFFEDSSFIDHITSNFDDGFSIEEKRCILEHEQTHIRHHDPFIRLAGILCICLHWWNPLVWLAVFKMNEDMEMFCDETVLRGASAEKRKEYANALLSFAVKENRFQAGLAFGESNTEKRVKNILYKRKKNWLVSLLTGLLAVFCATALMTVPKGTENSQAKPRMDTQMVKEPTVDTEKKQAAVQTDVQTDVPSALAYIEYDGYLDECLEWSDHTAFANQDYDGDGLTDRVLRTYQEGSEYCHYQILFGNNVVLDCDKDVSAYGSPTIEAADINGDGENEIILLLQYETSTDMTAFGDLAVFEKKGDAYVRAALPFEERETGYSQEVPMHLKQKQEQFITVSLDGTDLQVDVPLNDWGWEDARYKKELFTDCSCSSVIWDAFVAENGQLACKLNVFHQWSDYGLFLLLGYEDQRYVIEEVIPTKAEFSDSWLDAKEGMDFSALLTEEKNSYWLTGVSDDNQLQMYYRKDAIELKGKVKKSAYRDQLGNANLQKIQDTLEIAGNCTITFVDENETITSAYKEWVRISCEYEEGDEMSFIFVSVKVQDHKIVKIVFSR